MAEREVIEREIHHEPQRRRGGMLLGFVIAIVLVAGAVFGYLALSDDDDDGQIDVPSVSVDTNAPDVDVDADPGPDSE